MERKLNSKKNNDVNDDKKLYSTKTSSNERNSSFFYLYSLILSKKYYFMYSIVAIIIAISYYIFLNSYYIIDEAYDGDSLREYDILEKTTIRIEAPTKCNKLEQTKIIQDIISHYSLCQAVDNVQIIWKPPLGMISPFQPPSPKDFQYAHTHSKVSFEWDNDNKSYLSLIKPYLDINTDSVMFLDSDMFVSCQDLAFTQTVWRSGSDAVVGYFPRLHRRILEWEVLEWHSVWWNKAYSIMLTSGVIFHKKYLQNDNELSVELLSFLNNNSECTSVALSMWTAYQGAPAPIWVDIQSLSIKNEISKFLNDAVTENRRNQCLGLLSSILKVDNLKYSYSKAVKANRMWLWSI